MTKVERILVERLRQGHEGPAADRIEAISAENERLNAEVMRQIKWKTEAQNDADELAVVLDNIANESSDAWARGIARAALGETK